MRSTADPASTVASLRRYPVKSMLGAEAHAAAITPRGILGDRAWAVIDASNGKVASASKPRKWPKLLQFRADYVQPPEIAAELPPARITLPDGGHVTSSSRDVNEVLSGELSRKVRLEPVSGDYTRGKRPEQSFFDVAVLHVMTTATLDRLSEVYPKGRFEAQRFRPNIVVETTAAQRGFVEDEWIGRILAIGDDVRIRISRPCIRCVMTTLPQEELSKDPGILRTVTDANEARAGVYASVITPGVVRRGDHVRVLKESVHGTTSLDGEEEA